MTDDRRPRRRYRCGPAALARAVGADRLVLVVNTADDVWHHGLRSACAKRLQQISDKIEEYVKQSGQTGYDANDAANTLRSFLIHNGIFMAGTAFRG